LQVAIAIAKKFDASLTIIHVMESSDKYRRSGATGKILKRQKKTITKEEIQEECFDLLERSKRKVADEKISVHTLLKKGNIVKQILSTIRKEKFDLVVMGARGQSVIRKLILGSVSSGVLEKAKCPVLVTRL
jgi:nucleotide-binding universal stress UspA family protein